MTVGLISRSAVIYAMLSASLVVVANQELAVLADFLERNATRLREETRLSGDAPSE